MLGSALFDQARQLVRDFKGESYAFGYGVLNRTGALAADLGRRAVLVRDTFPGADAFAGQIIDSLKAADVEVAATISGASPNAPLEDLERISAVLAEFQPGVIVSFGGGSTIDCVKAAEVVRTLGGPVANYFGTGLVTARLQETGLRLTPHLAIQSAASSSAHLTKYSNITDLSAGQKKLIVDEAIVPAAAIFDFEATLGAPASLTADGALDGLSHCLEVYYGASGKPNFAQIEEIAIIGIALVREYLPRVMAAPDDREAREALALATDLGGCSIMLGGTNGAHLTSFSLIDILSHGRACALMNPYYTVFYSPAVQPQLRQVVALFGASAQGEGRALGEHAARLLIGLERQVGNPVRLQEVAGFTPAHIERALSAAKHPQLRMKLENMPVPLSPEQVDSFMGPVLEAAATGELSTVRCLPAGN
jgi:alcohol dehydrogenase